MRVGIFAYSVSSANGGIQQYTERLINALGKYTDTEVVVFCSPWNENEYEQSITDKVSIFRLDKGFWFTRYRVVRDIVNAIRNYKGQIESAVDVLHFPYQYMDVYGLDIPTLISLHDLQHEYFPEFFSENVLKWRNFAYGKSAEVCTRIIVSYEHAKRDITKFYHIPPEKIDVCGIGFEKPPDIDEGSFDLIRTEYNIPEEYIIYSAQTWPHKNHITLIRALKVLHEKYGKTIHLVCTGKKTNHFENIKKEIVKLELSDHVTFTDFLPSDVLSVLLKKARLSVIPTLYEAGSYPLLEAMAIGTPVICSNVTSLPEQIGDQRFVFDPYNVEGLASKLHLILVDDKLKEENIDNGKRQVEKISWDRMIQNFVNSYRTAIADFQSGGKANI